MFAVARGHGFNFSRLFAGLGRWCNGSNVEGPSPASISVDTVHGLPDAVGSRDMQNNTWIGGAGVVRPP